MTTPRRPGRRLRASILFAAAAAVSGCASVAQDSDSVRLTRSSADVTGCREIGYVQSWLSLSFRDARVQLRNRAVAVGGNTILVTSPFGETTGTVSECGEKKKPGPLHSDGTERTIALQGTCRRTRFCGVAPPAGSSFVRSSLPPATRRS